VTRPYPAIERIAGDRPVACSQLVGCVVLVVEDEPLIGLDLMTMLSAAGAHVISTV
jgi:hypothetical protein